MIQEIVLTPATVAILIAVIALAGLAVWRIYRNGLCDCNKDCDGCGKKRSKHERRKCSVETNDDTSNGCAGCPMQASGNYHQLQNLMRESPGALALG